MMRQPARRNRNIGTSKQGHGQDNRLVIPWPASSLAFFYERLTAYEVKEIGVRGRKLPVIIEKLKRGYFHSCSAADVETVLRALPPGDVAGLGFIVFRQPKKKELALNPAWGRLVYSYDFRNEYAPAIILEAVEKRFQYRFPKRQTLDARREFELLQCDGLAFRADRRHYVADLDEGRVRAIQLFRTLLHEVGHLVHYLDKVERPDRSDDPSLWLRRHDAYFRIPEREKEQYANRYARKWKAELTRRGVIPFARLRD
jgi:hypothetical protein